MNRRIILNRLRAEGFDDRKAGRQPREDFAKEWHREAYMIGWNEGGTHQPAPSDPRISAGGGSPSTLGASSRELV